MVESDRYAQFRESISQAPEFTRPFIANTPFGQQIWPFKEVELKKDPHLAEVVFEASSSFAIAEAGKSFAEDEDMDPMLVRVSYEEPYGLKAKKTLILRKFPDTDEFLMGSGEIRYNFGELDIVLDMNLDGPFATEGIVDNLENFRPTISVVAGENKPVPPVAFVEYNPNSQIPIHVAFSHADYQQALNGEVEKREKQGFNTPSYKKTYFKWEHLVGAKVGVTRYDDPKHPDDPLPYSWPTGLNDPFAQLEGSPYKEKISRGINWRAWGSGRLRFSRLNSQTGEIWMLSVPEWINKYYFHRDIQHSTLMDFFSGYPVVFCVKKPGESRKWFSTWSKKDKVI